MRTKLIGMIFAMLVLMGAVSARSEKGYAHPELLVETAWLAEHGRDPGVRIVDTRSAEAYAQGHIQGAIHFDLAKLRTKDEASAYLPLPDEFAAMMGALGIGTETQVVIYDDRGGVMGVRLWYVLDYYGHRQASLLNGGWNEWTKEARPVTTETPTPAKTEFKVKPNPQVLCSLDQVKSQINKPGAVILDARSPEEYTGARAQSHKGGHIPGAVNIEWRNNLAEDGRFKSAEELRRLYEQAGITPDKEIVTYCQSGGRAAHTLFALRLIGFDKSRNYYGSWSEWGNREDAPVEKPETQDSKPKPQD